MTNGQRDTRTPIPRTGRGPARGVDRRGWYYLGRAGGADGLSATKSCSVTKGADRILAGSGTRAGLRPSSIDNDRTNTSG